MSQGTIWEAGEGTGAGKNEFIASGRSCTLPFPPGIPQAVELLQNPPDPSFQHSRGFLQCQELWDNVGARTSLSKAFPILGFPKSTEDAQGWLNSLGKASALPPGIQCSLTSKILLFKEEIHVKIRPGGQKFQRLEVPHHSIGTCFSRMFSARNAPSKRKRAFYISH